MRAGRRAKMPAPAHRYRCVSHAAGLFTLLLIAIILLTPTTNKGTLYKFDASLCLSVAL